ncbi:MAG: hypothetical protein Q7K39_04310 [Candidatus Magasanikbacteria bacterium]|nr:hypothetical protein [Candidatus Magasanikbacteria bacterium]
MTTEQIGTTPETEKRRAITITEPATSYSASVADNEYGIVRFHGQTGLLIPLFVYLFVYRIVGQERIVELAREQFVPEVAKDPGTLSIFTTEGACVMPNLPSLTRFTEFPKREEITEIREKINALIVNIERALEKKERNRFN